MSGNTWGESWGIAGAFAWGDSWGFEGAVTPPTPTPTPTPVVTPGGTSGPRRARYRLVKPRRPKELDALEDYLVELKAQAAQIEEAKQTQRAVARAAFIQSQISEANERRKTIEAEFARRMKEYALELALREDEEETILLLM